MGSRYSYLLVGGVYGFVTASYLGMGIASRGAVDERVLPLCFSNSVGGEGWPLLLSAQMNAKGR